MEADAANYPDVVLAALPGICAGRGQPMPDSAFLSGSDSYVQGRYALAEAMRRAGVGAGSAVLLPTFHCRAMVEPALYLNAQPLFYRVKADLQPDFLSLAALMDERQTPVAAMLLTHYFGFPNALDEAEAFCALHGIALIEDCAHAFYGKAGGRVLGTVGSYAIASPWKFFPVRDGGLLRDNRGGARSRLASQPWLAEAKALAVMLSRCLRRTSLPDIDAAALRERAECILKNSVPKVPEHGLKEFLPEREGLSALRLSVWGMRHAPHGAIVSRRRDNYRRWLEGVSDVHGVQPLFPVLADGVVPYAFPLLVDGMLFHLLKLAGIPIWRWEDLAVTECGISRDYRVRLLQLPCHQSLQEGELEWLIRTVQRCAASLSER